MFLSTGWPLQRGFPSYKANCGFVNSLAIWSPLPYFLENFLNDSNLWMTLFFGSERIQLSVGHFSDLEKLMEDGLWWLS